MKRMKYISMMLASMALSASPLLAQEASAEAPLLSSGTLRSISSAQAKPSPEFRAYLRLLFADFLTDAAASALSLQISNQKDIVKNIDLFVEIALATLNSTPRSTLQGDEKALVDEVSSLLPELYDIYKATDMNNSASQKKMQMQLMFNAMMFSHKYPTVVASFDGVSGISNFVDMHKLQLFVYQTYLEVNGAKDLRSLQEMYAKIADMMRCNEI